MKAINFNKNCSTTVGTLEFRSVVEPIRKTKQHMEYYQAECTDINTNDKV